MRYEPERYYHTPCYESFPDPQPLKYAWPEEHYSESPIEVKMKYLAEDGQFVHCPMCGTIWATDDPMFKEVDKRYWHEVRSRNRTRRLELAADPVYQSFFKSNEDMWIHLKKLPIS